MIERCFGCGPENEGGMHLDATDLDDGSAEIRTAIPAMYCGYEGTVHGGIQAVLMDEVFARVVDRAVCERVGERRRIVTARLDLRYRRACPTEELVIATGFVETVSWPSLHASGAIRDESGAVLTTAKSRFRVVDGEPAPDAAVLFR